MSYSKLWLQETVGTIPHYSDNSDTKSTPLTFYQLQWHHSMSTKSHLVKEHG